jgi:uncharacterized protein with HEPN domain
LPRLFVPLRAWRLRIEDILGALAKIERYTAGATFEAFAANELLSDAVLRNIEIIGEAARHVPSDVQSRFPVIPWAKMQSMRNVVIHTYDEVSLTIVWDTIQVDLPPLVPLLRAVLEEP